MRLREFNLILIQEASLKETVKHQITERPYKLVKTQFQKLALWIEAFKTFKVAKNFCIYAFTYRIVHVYVLIQNH